MENDKDLFDQQVPVSKKPFRFLDHNIIESALRHSPTGNNAKPFEWEWFENALLLTHNVMKAQHYLNRADHASLIALGCTLMSVEVAAQAQGFRIQTTLPDFQQAAWAVRIEFIEANERSQESLAKMLAQRATYRKSFRPSSVSLELQEALTKMKEGEAELKIAVADKLSSAFRNYILKTETYLWVQSQATKDFLRGVRFLNRARTTAARGIPTTRLGINWFDQGFLAFLKILPSMASFLIRLPGLKSVFIAGAIKNYSHSHFIEIHLKNLDSSSIVQAGQLAMKVWLLLEEHGYKVQPMSSGSLCLLDALKGQLPEDTRSEFRTLFNETGPQLLAEQFQLNSQQHPVWLLRFGQAKESGI